MFKHLTYLESKLPTNNLVTGQLTISESKARRSTLSTEVSTKAWQPKALELSHHYVDREHI